MAVILLSHITQNNESATSSEISFYTDSPLTWNPGMQIIPSKYSYNGSRSRAMHAVSLTTADEYARHPRGSDASWHHPVSRHHLVFLVFLQGAIKIIIVDERLCGMYFVESYIRLFKILKECTVHSKFYMLVY